MSKWRITMTYFLSVESKIETAVDIEAEDATEAITIAKAQAKESGAFSSYRLAFCKASPIVE